MRYALHIIYITNKFEFKTCSPSRVTPLYFVQHISALVFWDLESSTRSYNAPATSFASALVISFPIHALPQLLHGLRTILVRGFFLCHQRSPFYYCLILSYSVLSCLSSSANDITNVHNGWKIIHS